MLMTDNWQPTVLQLLPFSSNNACSSQDEAYYEEEKNQLNRAFPRLAVTRIQTLQSQSKQHKIARAVSDYACRKKDARNSWSGRVLSRANSECNSRTRIDDKHTGYSIKDFNEQIIPSSNDSTSYSQSDFDRNWASSSGTDFSGSVKFLPKPNASRSLDGRYFVPKNGFWRAATFTPGEIDLQKQRNNFSSKSAKTKISKRHKVNASSIPRSTTPINDYDPDKLNMKQVIAFLQKKNGSVRADNSKPKSEGSKSRQDGFNDFTKETTRTTLKSKIGESVFLSPRKQKSADSTPREKVRIRKSTSEIERLKTRNANENRESFNNRDSKDKSIKNFRLHRFLSMASQNHGLQDTTVTGKQNCYQPQEDTPRENNHCLKSAPKSSSFKQTMTHTKIHSNISATNSHTRPHNIKNNANSTVSSPNSVEKYDGSHPRHGEDGIVRLPDIPRDDERPLTQETDSPDDRGLENMQTVDVSKKDIVFKFKLPVDNNKQSKKIQISLPNETTESHDKEIKDPVRLPLRKERSLTREHTYMSDLREQRNCLTNCNYRESILSISRCSQNDRSVEDID